MTQPEAVDDLYLGQYRWQNRLLLVFAPSATDPRLHRQSELFTSHPLEFEDRDLLTLYLAGGSADEVTLGRFSTEEVSWLREQYSVQPGAFAVLLIGKDGSLKHRFDQPVPAEEIFALIDVMPMRVQEMQADR